MATKVDYDNLLLRRELEQNDVKQSVTAKSLQLYPIYSTHFIYYIFFTCDSFYWVLSSLQNNFIECNSNHLDNINN